MDKLLIPYLNSVDELQTQANLDRLLALYAIPVVRRVMRNRLGFYVSAAGLNKHNQNAEDLFQETITRIVQRLSELRTGSSPQIDSFKQYVNRITTNMCVDFLRAKAPARAHLKDSVRELVRRHRDLDSWRHQGEVICGLRKWKASGTRSLLDHAARDAEQTSSDFLASAFPDTDIQSSTLSQVVVDLLVWIGGPVRLEDLVKMLVSMLQVREPEHESLDELDPNLTDPAALSESNLEAIEVLKRLWQALKLLPEEQRTVFVLGFADQSGQDLLTTLLVARVATVNELGEALGLSPEEILTLRLELPMDTKSIAARLNTSRSNVAKWRFRALNHLRAELNQ